MCRLLWPGSKWVCSGLSASSCQRRSWQTSSTTTCKLDEKLPKKVKGTRESKVRKKAKGGRICFQWRGCQKCSPPLCKVSCKVREIVCKRGRERKARGGCEGGSMLGRGNRFGEGQPAESQWEAAGVSWRCGGGHMEGRLALWLPPERTPACRGRHCQKEGREQQNKDGKCVFLEMHMSFGPLEIVSEDNNESYVYQPTACLLAVEAHRCLISNASLKCLAGTRPRKGLASFLTPALFALC